MEFCQVLLEDGGDVEMEVGLRDTDGGKKLELTITSSANALLGIEEKEFFQPYLRINNHYVGLGMALADRILRHHHGSIVFHKEAPERAKVIMVMEVAVGPAAPLAKKRIA
jgi:K+-sensing histidine kinase KdpD